MKLINIGSISSSYKEHIIPYDFDYFKKLKSRIIINSEYKDAIDGLKSGDLIEVIYFIDRVDKEKIRLNGIHPKGIKSNPATGLFNTRSPNRINPIGISTVKIIDIQDNEIEVLGLDAFDKSPVIDIKKHRPEYQIIEQNKIESQTIHGENNV